jgi:hypothetical protein
MEYNCTDKKKNLHDGFFFASLQNQIKRTQNIKKKQQKELFQTDFIFQIPFLGSDALFSSF